MQRNKYVKVNDAWEKDISGVAIGKVIKLAELFEVELSEIKVSK